MKLWIDDIRQAPDGYVWIRSVDKATEFIEIYENHYRRTKDPLMKITLIDIDHDAGDFGPPDYIAILDWLEETGRSYPIRIHSMNVVGVENMRRIIQRNGWTEVR